MTPIFPIKYKHHNEQQVESIKFDARHDVANNNYAYLRELNTKFQEAWQAMEVIQELREIYGLEFDEALRKSGK